MSLADLVSHKGARGTEKTESSSAVDFTSSGALGIACELLRVVEACGKYSSIRLPRSCLDISPALGARLPLTSRRIFVPLAVVRSRLPCRTSPFIRTCLSSDRSNASPCLRLSSPLAPTTVRIPVVLRCTSRAMNSRQGISSAK